MDASQCRAARGLLSWSQEELARRAGIGLSTVRVFERGGAVRSTNIEAIRGALEGAGVEFIPRGVRRSKQNCGKLQ
jgi:transcriptional regulator with XRE-family HTH domain